MPFSATSKTDLAKVRARLEKTYQSVSDVAVRQFISAFNGVYSKTHDDGRAMAAAYAALNRRGLKKKAKTAMTIRSRVMRVAAEKKLTEQNAEVIAKATEVAAILGGNCRIWSADRLRIENAGVGIHFDFMHNGDYVEIEPGVAAAEELGKWVLGLVPRREFAADNTSKNLKPGEAGSVKLFPDVLCAVLLSQEITCRRDGPRVLISGKDNVLAAVTLLFSGRKRYAQVIEDFFKATKKITAPAEPPQTKQPTTAAALSTTSTVHHLARKPKYAKQLPLLMKSGFKTLEGLSARKGNAKLAFLEKATDNPWLQDFFRFTYDWMVTYGVTRPFTGIHGAKRVSYAQDAESWLAFVKVLSKMASRKLTGGAATEALQKVGVGMSVMLLKWCDRLIRRDLKVGVTATLAGRVWPGMFSTFGVQLAHKHEDHPKVIDQVDALDWEPKLDGMRLFIVVTDSKNDLGDVYSRGGRVLSQLDFLVEQAANILHDNGVAAGCFDAEGVVAGSFNKSVGTLKSSTLDDKAKKATRIHVFEFLTLSEMTAGGCALPHRERRKRLEKMMRGQKSNAPAFSITPSKTVKLKGKDSAGRKAVIKGLLDHALDKGFEGVMLKDPEAGYEMNTRSKGWLKVKLFDTLDVKVVGFVESDRNPGTLGAFKVKDKKGRTFNVGGGLAPKQRKAWWPERQKYLNTIIEIREMKPVKGADITSRHPSFVRFRPDRSKL